MKRAQVRQLAGGLAFLAPNILGFLAFTLVPLVFSLVLAFSNWDLRRHNMFHDEQIQFVGLANFTRLLRQPDFWRFFGNTLFMMLTIPLSIAGSLGLALLLSHDLGARSRRSWAMTLAAIGTAMGVLLLLMAGAGGSGMTILLLAVAGAVLVGGLAGGSSVYRTLLYLPSFTSGVAVFILWKKLYNPNNGPINQMLAPLLHLFGLTPPAWLTDYYWAKPALMLMGFWISVGSNNMLLYLAGLSNIPPELYEAANIDGASSLQKFWNVTWPQLAPTTFFIIVMSIIGGLQGGFEMARTMTQGGPAGATTTLSYFIFSEGFETGRLGYSSAVAWVLFLMVLIITLFNWKVGSRYVND